MSSPAAPGPASQPAAGQQPVSKSKEFVSCLSDFFRRDLISLPLVKKINHSQIMQRCQIRAATLDLDTTAHPNIEYIAGNRLSIYPVNPADHVQAIMKHLLDDITPNSNSSGGNTNKRQRLNMSQPWQRFVQLYGKDSVRLALLHLYDITTAPSRDLLRMMAECCTKPDQKQKLLAICRTDDSWEKWICSQLRTLKSTLDEFNSCTNLSAKGLISELTLQQPRQYSISSIKSSKRFRTEIIVFQHKFTLRHIVSVVANLKEREESLKRRQLTDNDNNRGPSSPLPSGAYGPMQSSPISLHVHHNANQQQQQQQQQDSFSIRSLRSMNAFGTSPISTQQVKRVPSYSGPLMSLYASSTMNTNEKSSGSQRSSGGKSLILMGEKPAVLPSELNKSTSNERQQFDGLCSSYLLSLKPDDHVVCEFVENPRFTLKGNRERPIMMIGQDVGIVAFKPFWQQRALEYDRAQIFYNMFKDLSPKKFGDMQMVCLTGSRCKVEDLFRKELQMCVTSKIFSSVSHIAKSSLVTLLDHAALSSGTSAGQAKQLPIESKELLELGQRISRLLIDQNGCIYTCCDAQMTQAIEILIAESLARNSSLSRAKIMNLLPRWKGRKMEDQSVANNKFLYTLENPFERAQIVQEIYESSI